MATDERDAAREWRVTGRVQGVGFRAWAKRAAETLGVRGRAENLADGDVRVVGIGPAAALKRFERALGEGPPRARVASVERAAAPPALDPDELAGFEPR